MNKIYIGVGIVALIVVLIFIFGSGLHSSVNTKTNSGNSGSSASATTGQVKEFTMAAQRYSFTPRDLTVNKGDTVILHITSTDVNHGIAIPQFGVSQELPVGQEETVKFIADKAGNYTFFCNVYCGPGHGSMTGTLTVQ